MHRWLLHLAHDPQAFVGEIQAPTADLTGRGWLIERHLEGSSWAVAGPVERMGDEEWTVDVVPEGVPSSETHVRRLSPR